MLVVREGDFIREKKIGKRQCFFFSLLALFFIMLFVFSYKQLLAQTMPQVEIKDIAWSGQEYASMIVSLRVTSEEEILRLHCEITCVQDDGNTTVTKSYWKEQSPTKTNQTYDGRFVFSAFGTVTVRAWGVDSMNRKTSEVQKVINAQTVNQDTYESDGQNTNQNESKDESEEESIDGSKTTEQFESASTGQDTNSSGNTSVSQDANPVTNTSGKQDANPSVSQNGDTDISRAASQSTSENASSAMENTTNQSEYQDAVRKDRQKPTIEVQGVKPYANQKEAVSVSVLLRDDNLDFSKSEVCLMERTKKKAIKETYKTRQKGSLQYEFYNVNEDGTYQIEAIARDMAGNETKKTVIFSMNLTGTTFDVKSDIEPYMNHVPNVAIQIKNQKNVSIVSCCVNGKKVGYTYEKKKVTLKKEDDEVWQDGAKVITLIVRDLAGNVNELLPIRFVLDRQAPVLDIQQLEDGKTYYTRKKITVRLQEKEDKLEEIVLNGQKIRINEKQNSAAITISDYGTYELFVRATDQAGNESKKTVTFYLSRCFPFESKKVCIPNVCYLLSVILFFLLIGTRVIAKKKNPYKG